MKPEHYTDATEAELKLLGCTLANPWLVPELAEIVSRQCFHTEAGEVFQLMVDLTEAGKPISDLTVLTVELKRAGILDKLGSGYIAKAAGSVVEGSSALWYAARVRELWHYRELDRIGAKFMHSVEGQSEPPESIKLRLESELEQIVELDNQGDVQTLGELVGEALEEVRDAKQRGVTLGLPSGLADLDDATGGFFNGDLTILAARPSIGKSAFAIELAARVAERQKRVLIVSLEMSGKQIAHRFLNRETAIPVRTIQQAEVNTFQDIELIEAKERLRQLPLKTFVSSSATVQQIRARAKVQIAQEGLDLLIVDYLGLIGGNSRLSSYERITTISRELKQLAMHIDRPVLCLAQLNREAARANLPSLEHLRDSGAIEQDADNVWLLHRDDRATADTKLIIAKQRQGCVGTIPLTFNADRMSFSDTPRVEAWQA